MSAPSAPSTTGISGRVPALDGIRALAVTVVLLFHLRAPGFGAGFLGVDVFFVLSGFLITGLLLDDVRRHDTVRLGRFWTRRFRRLMPAFVVMVLAVIGWAATVALPLQRDDLRADAFWSLLYVGNWHFIRTSSYFESTGSPSPLQHVWSLAVEEQFYVLWPVVVAALAWQVRCRAARRSRTFDRVVRAVALAATLVAVGSAVLLAVLADPVAPERAYMGTDTRAFEPLAGAALACLLASERVRSACARVATPLVVIGLAGLAVGTATLGSFAAGAAPAYYSGGAVAFTLTAVALVAGVAARPTAPLGRLLGTTPLAWVGQMSYGIYLWHWPLRVWIVPDDTFRPLRSAAVVVLSVLLAALSFYVVERPVREGRLSRWLTGRRTLATVTGVVLACVALTGVIRAPEAPPGRSLVFVGDSVPKRLAPMLADWARTDATYGQWQFTDGAVGGCPPFEVVPRLGDAVTPHLPNADCPKAVDAAHARAFATGRADVVVWWSRAEEYDRLSADGGYLEVGTPAFWDAQRADLRAAVARLRDRTGAAVVLVGVDRPGRGMTSRCTAEKCHPFLRRLLEQDELRTTWNQVLAEEAAALPGVAYVEVDDLYCRDRAVPCDDRIADGSLARPDGSHFARPAVDALAAPLLGRVTAAAREASAEE